MIPRRRITTYPQMLRDILFSFVRGKALRGNDIARFEKMTAQRLGVRHAIAVSSGRFGMRLILDKMGLQPGDEVILPAYTQVELPQVIADAGYCPVMADVAPGDLNCSASQIAEKITPKTRVIIITHMSGEAAADTLGILALAEEKGIMVMEDNAHGIGVQLEDGRFLGSLGKASFLSLETRKVVNTFGGGVVLTSDDALASSIRTAVDPLAPSLTKLMKRIFSVFLEDLSLTGPLAAVITRLLHSNRFKKLMIRIYRGVHRANRDTQIAYSNLQAILGARQLELLDSTLQYRRELGETYLKGLENIPEDMLDADRLKNLRRLIDDDKLVRHNFYSVIVFGNNTENLASRLLADGVDIGVGEDTCEDLPSRYGITEGYPNTKEAIRRGIQLPMFSKMTIQEVNTVCKAIKNAC